MRWWSVIATELKWCSTTLHRNWDECIFGEASLIILGLGYGQSSRGQKEQEQEQEQEE